MRKLVLVVYQNAADLERILNEVFRSNKDRANPQRWLYSQDADDELLWIRAGHVKFIFKRPDPGVIQLYSPHECWVSSEVTNPAVLAACRRWCPGEVLHV